MLKVYLLYKSVGKQDQLVSIHSTKKSAILAKQAESRKKIGNSTAGDLFYFFVIEKYVLE